MQRCKQFIPMLYKIGRTNKHIYKACYSVSAAEIPIPSQGEDKQYSNKITTLVEDISSLTLIEVKDLNDLLKKKLNITEVQAVAAVAPAVADAQSTEVAEDSAQQDFTIKLTDFNKPDKIKLIKSMKSILPDLNLAKAKAFVESLPQVVKKDISKEEVDQLKKQLEEAGGVVEVE